MLVSGKHTERKGETGGGAMVGAIKGSTKKEPLVVGKPSTFMMDYLASEYEVFSYSPHLLWLLCFFLTLSNTLLPPVVKWPCINACLSANDLYIIFCLAHLWLFDFICFDCLF